MTALRSSHPQLTCAHAGAQMPAGSREDAFGRPSVPHFCRHSGGPKTSLFPPPEKLCACGWGKLTCLGWWFWQSCMIFFGDISHLKKRAVKHQREVAFQGHGSSRVEVSLALSSRLPKAPLPPGTGRAHARALLGMLHGRTQLLLVY